MTTDADAVLMWLWERSHGHRGVVATVADRARMPASAPTVTGHLAIYRPGLAGDSVLAFLVTVGDELRLSRARWCEQYFTEAGLSVGHWLHLRGNFGWPLADPRCLDEAVRYVVGGVDEWLEEEGGGGAPTREAAAGGQVARR